MHLNLFCSQGTNQTALSDDITTPSLTEKWHRCRSTSGGGKKTDPPKRKINDQCHRGERFYMHIYTHTSATHISLLTVLFVVCARLFLLHGHVLINVKLKWKVPVWFKYRARGDSQCTTQRDTALTLAQISTLSFVIELVCLLILAEGAQSRVPSAIWRDATENKQVREQRGKNEKWNRR